MENDLIDMLTLKEEIEEFEAEYYDAASESARRSMYIAMVRFAGGQMTFNQLLIWRGWLSKLKEEAQCHQSV